MKKLSDKDRQLIEEGGAAVFTEKKLARVKDVLAANIDPNDLDWLNGLIKAQNRRELDLDDLSRIAYVHVMSILENKGASPNKRIISFCRANGYEYDNVHVGKVTDFLTRVEFISLVDGDSKPGKCRVYSIPNDVLQILKSPTFIAPTPKSKGQGPRAKSYQSPKGLLKAKSKRKEKRG